MLKVKPLRCQAPNLWCLQSSRCIGNHAAARHVAQQEQPAVDRQLQQPAKQERAGKQYTKSTMLGRLADQTGGVARVVLKRDKARLFRLGQPMVYSGAVDRVLGKEPAKGDVVLLTDGAETPLGWGVYNGSSMFRVRLMQLESQLAQPGAAELALNLERTVAARLAAAHGLRESLGLSDAGAWRLVNSEGDRLSGLVVDVLHAAEGGALHLAVQSSAAWVERHQALIEQHLRELFLEAQPTVHWQRNLAMLKEECWAVTENNQQQQQQQQQEGRHQEHGAAPGLLDKCISIREHGISYHVPLSGGQKTGFYADQRDSRALIQSLSRGRSMLDLCCYSGGFALNAAKGGAARALGVDTSAAALELAQANAAANGMQDVCGFERADVQDWMKVQVQERIGEPPEWDVVVLDPPKLAPNRRSLDRASSMYRKLNSLAMRMIKPGGLLMTCSCSGAMTQSNLFIPKLQEAAAMAHRQITVLRVAGAAPDHTWDPAYPEGVYLTNVLLRVH